MSVPLSFRDNYRIDPGSHPELGKIAACAVDDCADEETSRKERKALRQQINGLAEKLAVENKGSLLIILQGMDASRKDGTVKKVFTGVNPQHCRVVSFKQPDREERELDSMWRVVRHLPALGEIGAFNRSQYEDVVALQGRGEIGRKEAHMRLRQIDSASHCHGVCAVVCRPFGSQVVSRRRGRRHRAVRAEGPAAAHSHPRAGHEQVSALAVQLRFTFGAQLFHHGLDEGFGAFHAGENRLQVERRDRGIPGGCTVHTMLADHDERVREQVEGDRQATALFAHHELVLFQVVLSFIKNAHASSLSDGARRGWSLQDNISVKTGNLKVAFRILLR